ncbi:hypothetical protein MMC20_004801 [Loxospora ochrophaea]|nr:hypothetical protein [Loxospora ochrophaea]
MDMVGDESVPDRGPTVIATAASLAVIAAILVAIRIARRIYTSALGLDDYLIVVAVVSVYLSWTVKALSIARSTLDIVLVKVYGFGKHEVDLPPNLQNSHASQLGFWVAQILYTLSIFATKESILLLYHRIFVSNKGFFRIALYTVIGIVASYYTASFVATIFECNPVQGSWMKQLHPKCINTNSFFFANAGFNIASDVMIMVLPIPILNTLQITKKQRVGLFLVFFVGIFATATSIIRMFSIRGVNLVTDSSFATSGSTIWSTCEINVSIICACMPSLKAPLQALFPRIFGRDKVGSSIPPFGSHYGPQQSSQIRTRSGVHSGWSRITPGRKVSDGPSGVMELGSFPGRHDSQLSDDQKHILYKEEDSGIMKTTDIHVRYGEAMI